MILELQSIRLLNRKSTVSIGKIPIGVFFNSDVIYPTNEAYVHEPQPIDSDYASITPLVRVEATLDDNYFKANIDPQLYSPYPLGRKYHFENKAYTVLGTPPKYALPRLPNYLNNPEYEVNDQRLRTMDGLKVYPYVEGSISFSVTMLFWLFDRKSSDNNGTNY